VLDFHSFEYFLDLTLCIALVDFSCLHASFMQDTRHVAHVKAGMRKAHQELTTWSSMQQEHFIFWLGLRNSPHGVVVYIVEGCSWPLFVLICNILIVGCCVIAVLFQYYINANKVTPWNSSYLLISVMNLHKLFSILKFLVFILPLWDPCWSCVFSF
jgi:hypothetical protein